MHFQRVSFTLSCLSDFHTNPMLASSSYGRVFKSGLAGKAELGLHTPDYLGLHSTSQSSKSYGSAGLLEDPRTAFEAQMGHFLFVLISYLRSIARLHEVANLGGP